jgi:ceramide glucosyltransferase
VRAIWLIFLPALVYQLLAIAAALNHLRRRYTAPRRPQSFAPPVSILKPLRGLDPNTYDAFVSQAAQQYPEFELLFGVADQSDPAVTEVSRLEQQFPAVRIRLIAGSEALANGKVGVLARLAQYAQNPVWVVNDSDIRVNERYLAEVVAPLAEEDVGVVTCLYRPRAHTLPALWEALGISTDFMPSTLVAQLIGVREFGLGSTLAFRAQDLAQAGGFAAIGDYLADDYQLAKRITQNGKRALLSTYTVETSLGDKTWSGSWQHQLRWARTIRASKGGGHAGLPFTQTSVWIVLALAIGAKSAAIALLIVRLLAAFLGGCLVLENPLMAALFWLAPLWDLYAFCIWLTSYGGREVRWRDRSLQIARDGRIVRNTGS